jgi:Carboxypeptidase regulatory-like domain
MQRRLAVALLAAVLAARLDARTVTVHVSAGDCKEAMLRATPATGERVERRWTGDDVSFDLPDGAWTITATAAECWASPVAADASAVAVKLWPAATLRFRLEEPRDAPVQVRISSPAGKIAPTDIYCARAGTLRTCSVPAMPLDLRISAAAFAPQYIFDREIAPRAHVDLGAVRLARGASVSGRVSLPQKNPKLENISVRIAPSALLTRGADPVRVGMMSQTVKTNRRGFFQFGGLDEGTYTLVAVAEGWSAASASDVHVAAGAEVALPKPLELAPLATLDVVVEPPTDSGGRPWRINLLRTWPVSAEPVEPLRGAFSPAGEWRGRQLAAGRYSLSVEDADGSTFHRRFVDVRENAAPVHVAIDAFRVRGRVTFRGDPVECGIWFTHPLNATASIRLRSDKEGKFETVFPEEGEWAAQLTLPTNHAQLRNFEVRRRSDGAPVDLDLALPPGRIRGTTVDDDGAPIASAVRILSEGRFAGSVRAPDGKFDFVGIQAGDVMVHARAEDRDSGLVPVHVSETEQEPVTVVVPKRKKAKAWVVTAAGQPIAGALVRYWSAGSLQDEVTGPSGELTLPVPQSETAVPMIVLPPGLPRKMLTLTLGPEPAEIVISPVGSRLLLTHAPKIYWVAHGDTIFSGHLLFEPSLGGPPREATPAGLLLELEPGSYSFCTAQSRERCKTFVLQAGTTTNVNVEAIFR